MALRDYYISFVNIGFGHAVCINKVKYLTLPRTAPGIRLARLAKKDNRFVDATCGKVTKTLIVLDDNTVIACAYTPATTMARFRKAVFEFADDTTPKEGTKEWLNQYKAQLLIAAQAPADPENEDPEPEEEVVELDPDELLEYERNIGYAPDDDIARVDISEPDAEDDEIPDEIDDDNMSDAEYKKKYGGSLKEDDD